LHPGSPDPERPRVSIERRIIVALVLTVELAVILAIGRKLVGPGPWEYWVLGTFVICILLAAIRPDWVERLWNKREE
jgi:hypothetical protein